MREDDRNGGGVCECEEVGVDVEGGKGVISEGVIWDGVGDGYRLWSI